MHAPPHPGPGENACRAPEIFILLHSRTTLKVGPPLHLLLRNICNCVRHTYIPNSVHCVPGRRSDSSNSLPVLLTHHRHPMHRFHPCTLSTVDPLIWVPFFHFRSHCRCKHHPEGCGMPRGCLWHCATRSRCPEDIPLADRLGRP